jgi:ketosteroid isomerase-like protein
MKTFLSPILITAVLWFGGQSNASADSLRNIAETNVHQWNLALEQRDLDLIMTLYADNAIVLEPNGHVSRTRDAIRSFWRSVLNSANVEYSFDVDQIQKSTSKIVLAAKWFNRSQLSATAPGSVHRTYDGKMTNVLVRQDDGTWKAQVQRWN